MVHHPHEQPSLEVVSEPEAPQVVTVHDAPQVVPGQFGQSWAGTAQSPYKQQQHELGQYPQQGYLPQSGYTESSSPGSNANWTSDSGAPPIICSIPRRRFWFIFGPLIAVLVIGLAVGLGVGLGSAKSNDSATSTTSSTATSTSATSSATTTSSSLTCGFSTNSNGTIYVATNNTDFLVLCGLDYNSNGDSNTAELSDWTEPTAEACADKCASTSGCVGAGYGNYNDTYTCWLKSKLGTPGSATPAWYFLIKE